MQKVLLANDILASQKKRRVESVSYTCTEERNNEQRLLHGSLKAIL
jgi:hypothetical protein